MSEARQNLAWQNLADELRCWQDQGQSPRFWWRDDDAVAYSAALEKLLSITTDAAVPLMLAVIPAHHDPAWVADMAGTARVRLAVHGFDHGNRAGAGQKKSEFPAMRTPDDVAASFAAARAIGRNGFSAGDIFVPPWNRLPSLWRPALVAAGFCGLSGFTPREAAMVDGLICCNTHVDVMDWRSRCFAGDDAVLAALCQHLSRRRQGLVDADEPTGLLTHHLVHDAAVWDFLVRLIGFLAERLGDCWVDPFADDGGMNT